MTALLVVAILLAPVTCTALVLATRRWWHSAHGELAIRAKREVIVTLKTGETFTGALYASDRDCLVLRNAEAIGFGPDSRNAPVQGEAVLLRSNVAYVQAT